MQMSSPALLFAQSRHVTDGGKPLDILPGGYEEALFNAFCMSGGVIKSSTQTRKTWITTAIEMYRAWVYGMRPFNVLPTVGIRNRFAKRLKKLQIFSKFYANAFRGEQSAETRTMHSPYHGPVSMWYVGSNAPGSLTEAPADTVRIDEVDRCDQNNLPLAFARKDESEYGFVTVLGNPTVPGSYLANAFGAGTGELWHTKCKSCNTWQHYSWHDNIVDPDTLRPFDREWKEGGKDDMRIICSGRHANRDKCGRPMARHCVGEYVAERRQAMERSFHISKLFAGRARIDYLYLSRFMAGRTHAGLLQSFWNDDMGLELLIGARKFNLEFAAYDERNSAESDPGPCVMGIDTGGIHYYVIMNRWRQILSAGRASSREELETIYRRFNCRMGMVDAGPELELVRKMQASVPGMWRCTFPDASKRTETEWVMRITDANKEAHRRRRMLVSRTSAIDWLHSAVEEFSVFLPIDWRSMCDGEFAAHCAAPVRSWDNVRGQYVWSEGSKPDHLLMSWVYCLMSWNIARQKGVFV